ncbi:hypothetical protein [Variovorax sp. Root473]|uniref:hypothetical protein n=1 Tax=Variovorax sp. Root473 TaxID=1736541 RepID=UPI000A933AF2|nr:hypothetical protein [Variovorax sp. Root473]
MADDILILCGAMTEKFTDDLRATGAHPEMFVRSPSLHARYLRNMKLAGRSG